MIWSDRQPKGGLTVILLILKLSIYHVRWIGVDNFLFQFRFCKTPNWIVNVEYMHYVCFKTYMIWYKIFVDLPLVFSWQFTVDVASMLNGLGVKTNVDLRKLTLAGDFVLYLQTFFGLLLVLWLPITWAMSNWYCLNLKVSLMPLACLYYIPILTWKSLWTNSHCTISSSCVVKHTHIGIHVQVRTAQILCWLAKIEGGHTRTIYLTNATVMMMDGFVKVEGTKSWNKLINDTVSIKCSLKWISYLNFNWLRWVDGPLSDILVMAIR